MITILVSLLAGLMTDENTGWAVFFSLIAFQVITGQL